MFQTVPPSSLRNKYYNHSFARMTAKMLGVMVVNLLISSLMSRSRFVCWLQANPSSFTGHPAAGYPKSQQKILRNTFKHSIQRFHSLCCPLAGKDERSWCFLCVDPSIIQTMRNLKKQTET